MEKEDFHDKLEQTYRQYPNNDVKVIIGSMNAKVGQEEMYRPTNHQESNDNGTLLMTISSTYFQHKHIHT